MSDARFTFETQMADAVDDPAETSDVAGIDLVVGNEEFLFGRRDPVREGE